RRLFDIIWGCLTTIFACTWVSVHPNVPAPDQGRLALLWRRLRLMLVAVTAPELMVAFAARQFLAARKFARDYSISQTHGFFFYMGGFVSRVGNSDGKGDPIATRGQLQISAHAVDYISDIQKTNKDDIMDKSKGDAFSKGVALAQGLWFTTQCLARVAQNLPVTEIEVATLAFAVVNVFIWALWWGK
ncbi:hypothetical protein B0H19DRAFT_886717, partial [Mycena capillaripes]